MKVENINISNASYAGQGSSSAATSAVASSSGSAGADVSTKQQQSVSSVEFSKTENGEQTGSGRDTGRASNEQIAEAVEKINKSSTNTNQEAVFGIHDATHRVTIKIVDKKTKEVIKEFPPEKTLDMIAKVWEMAGLMVDEKR